jgi:hypothetical protein
MKKYFIIDGFRRLGPFDEEELKAQNINPQTIIWTFDEGEKNAKDFPELAFCFGTEVSKNENIIIEEPQKDDNQKERENKLLEEYEKIKKEKEEKLKNEEQQKLITTPPQPIVEFQNNDSQENIYENVEDEEIQENEEIDEDEEIEEDEEIDEDEEIEEDEIEEDISTEEEKHVEFKIDNTQYQSSQNTSYSSSFETKVNNSGNTTAKKPLYFGLSNKLAFLCFPLGIVAIIFSSNAKKAFEEGDIEMGNQKASVALIINIVSMIVDLSFG